MVGRRINEKKKKRGRSRGRGGFINASARRILNQPRKLSPHGSFADNGQVCRQAGFLEEGACVGLRFLGDEREVDWGKAWYLHWWKVWIGRIGEVWNAPAWLEGADTPQRKVIADAGSLEGGPPGGNVGFLGGFDKVEGIGGCCVYGKAWGPRA